MRSLLAVVTCALVVSPGCSKEGAIEAIEGAVKTVRALDEMFPDDPDYTAMSSLMGSVGLNAVDYFETPKVTNAGVRMEPWLYPEQAEWRCVTTNELPNDEPLWSMLGARDTGRSGHELCYRASPDRKRFAATLTGRIESSGAVVRYCLRGSAKGEEAVVAEAIAVAADAACEP